MVTGQDSWVVLVNAVDTDLVEVDMLPFNEDLPSEWAGWLVDSWFETEAEAIAKRDEICEARWGDVHEAEINRNDTIKAQAMKRDNVTCVSWWHSGRVSQVRNHNVYYDNGMVGTMTQTLPDLPATTQWNEVEYYQLVETAPREQG